MYVFYVSIVPRALNNHLSDDLKHFHEIAPTHHSIVSLRHSIMNLLSKHIDRHVLADHTFLKS